MNNRTLPKTLQKMGRFIFLNLEGELVESDV